MKNSALEWCAHLIIIDFDLMLGILIEQIYRKGALHPIDCKTFVGR